MRGTICQTGSGRGSNEDLTVRTYAGLRPLDDGVEAVSDSPLGLETVRLGREFHERCHHWRQEGSKHVRVKVQALAKPSAHCYRPQSAALTSTHSRMAIAAVRRTTASDPGPSSCSRCTRTCHSLSLFAVRHSSDTSLPRSHAILRFTMG